MPSRRDRFILWGLLALTIGSLWRLLAVEREGHRIARAYRDAQQMAQQLEEERTLLSRDLSDANQTIEGQSEDLQRAREAVRQVKARLDQTVIALATLQQQHAQLRDHATALEAEKQQLEARLSSLKELKVALRDLTRHLQQQRWAAWRAGLKRRGVQAKENGETRLAVGNHGYLIRNGVPTLGSSVRMRVQVLDPQSH